MKVIQLCLTLCNPVDYTVHGTLQARILELVQFNSVAQLCPTVYNSMNCSTPGPPVHHQLPEPTQTHVHWIGDAIQPSHPLSSPSPPALNLSQQQGLFQMSQLFASGSQSIGVLASTSVLPMNTQDWSPLGWLVGPPCSSRDSQESSPAPQFKSINILYSAFFMVLSSHIHTWLLEKP